MRAIRGILVAARFEPFVRYSYEPFVRYSY